MDDVLYRVDVDISRARANIRSLDAEFKRVEGNANKSTNNISKNGGDEIRKLGFALERFGISGLAAFGEITAVAGGLGLAIGGILVTVNLLVKAVSFFARVAKDAFVAATTASVETGKQFDVLKAQLTAVFEGSPEAADAAFRRIREMSRELGFDATELARTFIPEVSSLDQLEEVVKLGAALARFQPEQGVTGARIALQGALEGTAEGLRSLQRRFELPKAAIDRIKELQGELGITEGLIVGLGEELERTGRSLDDLGGTLDVSIGRATEFFRDLRGVAGEPIVDKLIEEFGILNKLLVENEDELDIIANAFGEAVASIIDLLGDLAESLLENLDEEKALELANSIKQLGLGIEALIKTLAGDFDTTGLDLVLRVVNEITLGVNGLALAIAKLKPTFAYLANISSQVSENRANTGVGEKLLIPGISNASNLLDVDLAEAQEAYNEAAIESIGILTELALGTMGVADANQEYADSLGDVGNAGDAAADGILSARDAAAAQAEELAALEEDALAAVEKVQDEKTEYMINKERARLDMLKEQKRKEIDLEIELSQKREDIERGNLEKLQDIYREHAQRIADAQRDLRYDEADIALEFARKEEDLAIETAEKKIKIEEDFRRELDEIRRKFEFDAQEAIRANDAIEYLRIQRRADFELQEAREKKEEETQTVTEEAEKQYQELARLRERELEDARTANARQIEELQIRLQRELEEQQIAYQRDLEQLAIFAQRKREELRLNAQRELEDFNETWARRLDDLQRNLEKELEIIRRYEALKAQIQAQARARARAAALEAAAADAVLLQNYRYPGGNQNPIINTPQNQQEASSADAVLLQNLPGRRFGGPTFPGRRYIVGEDGPEVFLPGQIGSIFPLRKTLNSLLFSPPMSGNSVNTVINRDTRVDLSMLDPSNFSPQQLAIMRRVFTQLMADVM